VYKRQAQAVHAIERLYAYPCIIVCPASLKYNWLNEINKWFPALSVQIINGSDELESGHDYYIVNYDILGRCVSASRPFGRKRKVYEIKENSLVYDLLSHTPQAIVFDESHYLKNTGSLRSRACRYLCEEIAYVFMLSGTPILNKPSEFAHQLQCLDVLDDMGGWKYYMETYCGAKRDKFGWKYDDEPSNLVDLNEEVRRVFYMRRTKEEVLPDLPDVTQCMIEVPLTNRKTYDAAETDFIEWLYDTHLKQYGRDAAEIATDRASNAETLSKLNTLRQLAGIGKIEAVKEFMTDFEEASEKLVLFCHHLEIQRRLSDPTFARLYSGDNGATRQENVRVFMEEPSCLFMIAGIEVGGVGHTLTSASHVGLIEQPWTPAKVDQAIARVHRIGQDLPVTVYHFVSENTIDQRMIAMIEEKRKTVDALIDGRMDESISIFTEVINSYRKEVGDD
jgi:SWI/SNF-related matrix-associated actin-dependent regulator 1 of chromatin subfamily A